MDYFLFSRVNSSASEDASEIIRRKELERISENGKEKGCFYWGASQGVNDNYLKLLVEKANTRSPVVHFCMTDNKTKKTLPRPKKVRWTAYAAEKELVRLPEGVTIYSYKYTDKSVEINKYYALVCRSKSALTNQALSKKTLYLDAMRHIGTGNKLGQSVNSPIRYDTNIHTGKCYKTIFSAELIYPYFVRLTCPEDV
jgi:hypothetical protein